VCGDDGGCYVLMRPRRMLICGRGDRCWRAGRWNVVLRGMVKEIGVCCSGWCIFEPRAGDSVVLVVATVLMKGVFLRSPVGDWGLFGLLASYWLISGEDLELTDSFSFQETWHV